MKEFKEGFVIGLIAALISAACVGLTFALEEKSDESNKAIACANGEKHYITSSKGKIKYEEC